ncbi:enoyl-CoA hydratase-related protein [Sphingosinithalassobacter portus]|uniref:enoyl-CoA hydratase-related protein n=1 Tax=Stakelama portus TaxID=2676234 RepID=UPI000D6E8E33|nr:enoyl-CoA hydratase-related protein [Sphingosinithalassobacter portus]
MAGAAEPKRTPETTPVIVGIGEFVDRPENPADAREPVALMAEALRAADIDGGGGLLDRLESIELIGLISWRYENPVGLLCEKLGIAPARQVNASMGGETPIRLIHEAAVRIAKGELTTAAIVGGEAMHARNAARKAKAKLDWTPLASRESAVQFPMSRYAMSPVARKLRIMDPAQIYPFYEMATQKAWGEPPAEAQAKSAELWARYAKAAAANPYAWIRSAPDAAEIADVSKNNRLINWPYPKFMVANPSVNQAGAVIVTSLAAARAAGVPDDRLVHIWGGAKADEPEDYLQRDRYDHSTAQTAALEAAVDLVGGDVRRFGPMELYSCFPVVPKMALRTLGLTAEERSPTVAGGLTFFGGPLNNYMTHAMCAMVRRLRDAPEEIGLLYGQGGYVNKHHTMVVSVRPPEAPMALEYSVQAKADAAREPAPELAVDYFGPATIETYTITYGRDGRPIDGIVIARTPKGARAMARIPWSDEAGIALLQSAERNAIGTEGHIRTDPFGKPIFELGAYVAPAKRPLKYCMVEREGPLTIVTINRPDSMNALTPQANAELAELFDDFAADPDQWVAILTGAGDRAFSSGNDLKATSVSMARGAPLETPVTGFAGLTSRFDLDKPVIAAVNGVAMGGGFEIALACDLIVASENALFALPEPKVGLAALAGGLLRLPRQIGLKQAMGMILTGRRVPAQEGMALGFVNEVVPQGAALAGARRWAESILECSPMSIRASKQVVRKGLDTLTLAEIDGEQDRLPAVKALFRSADVREGPLAFAEKRKPNWKGR